MTPLAYSSVVVKVGTNVITGEDGLLDRSIMRSLTHQIAELKKQNVTVTLVSSGAMGAGRAIVQPSKMLKDVSRRQVLAAVGQVELIHTYASLFAEYGYIAAQVLATKEDFRDREHYLNMRHCFEALLAEKIVPVVNENDVVSVSELMFTDNDELAGLIASMIDADTLILLTNVDGIYDGNPKDPSSQVIPEIEPDSTEWKSLILPEKSQFGRGGMLTKCATAKKLSALGITTHIANGKSANILLEILAKKSVGTVFRAEKQSSSVKRWVAGSEGREKGVVTISKRAEEVILSKEKAVSLLPIGIIRIEGAFEKGDLVKICGENGKAIGLGRTSYGYKQAKESMGKKGGKALIHYDYLVLL